MVVVVLEQTVACLVSQQLKIPKLHGHQHWRLAVLFSVPIYSRISAKNTKYFCLSCFIVLSWHNIRI